MGQLDAVVLPLVDVYQFWKTLNFTVVFTLHCLFCASLAPQLKDKYLVHYLVCVLATPNPTGVAVLATDSQWSDGVAYLPLGQWWRPAERLAVTGTQQQPPTSLGSLAFHTGHSWR